MATGLLEVLWPDGRIVGRLAAPGPVYFEYDPEWLRTGYDLSPLSLPFGPGAQRKKDPFFHGLPGVIADCLPDSWGETVMKRVFHQKQLGRVTPLKALAWVGSRGMGAISFRPEFPEGRPAGSWEAVRAETLAREARAVVRGRPADLFPHIAASGGSVGGARPKALVAIERDGTMAYGGAPTRLPGATFQILKFDQSPHGGEARAEYAYALMARAAGIPLPPMRLIPANDRATPGRCHLLIERFDVLATGQRRHVHTLCGLLERPARTLDYADFLRASLRLIVQPDEREAAVRAVIRRMVFNVLAVNDDDHGKNHAFILLESERDWRLTPAYDLTFSPVAGPAERGMSVQGNGFGPSRQEMSALAGEVGIRPAEFSRIFQAVADRIEQWPDFAERSGLKPDLRQSIGEELAARGQAVDA